MHVIIQNPILQINVQNKQTKQKYGMKGGCHLINGIRVRERLCMGKCKTILHIHIDRLDQFVNGYNLTCPTQLDHLLKLHRLVWDGEGC